MSHNLDFNFPSPHFLTNTFKKSVSALADKRRDYLSAFEILDDTGDFTARLLFADSASVIQDCIEIISDAAREYGIPIA